MVHIRVVTLLSVVLMVKGVPLNQSGNDIAEGASDQLMSGTTTVQKSLVPDPQVAVANTAKGDLKTSDSFGLGYYLPIVAPALAVKYHYPFVYYPAAYLHSIRHHGYGGFGYYHHGHGVLH